MHGKKRTMIHRNFAILVFALQKKYHHMTDRKMHTPVIIPSINMRGISAQHLYSLPDKVLDATKQEKSLI